VAGIREAAVSEKDCSEVLLLTVYTLILWRAFTFEFASYDIV
jgi:hypothetical protein